MKKVKELRPEALIAMECLKYKRAMITLENELQGNEISSETYWKEFKILEPIMKSLKKEATDRFVAYEQNYKNDMNREEGYTDWVCSWRDYFQSLDTKRKEVLKMLEAKAVDGNMAALAQVELPEQFRIESFDLSKEDWKELRSGSMPKWTNNTKLGKSIPVAPNALAGRAVEEK